jgi:SAM-dependent methyltransferase
MKPDDPFTKIFISSDNIISRSRNFYKSKGVWCLMRAILIHVKETLIISIPNNIRCWSYKTFRSNDTFEFQGTTYKYFFHAYCTTWRNERTVAVPIIWNLVRRFEEQNKEILEVGNVLSYYYKVSHDILDKYEIMDGVINEDVVDFKPSKQYDLIVSIVTLEHVGWSESPRETLKIVRAYENLKSLLSPGGQLILVVALQFNLEFDSLCRSDKIRFSKQYFMRHLKGYEWQEASWKDVSHLKYDHSVPTANAIMIAQLPG